MQNYSFICSKHCICRSDTKPNSSGLNSSSKNVRECNRCIRHYEKGDLGTDFHSLLARWRNYCSQQLSWVLIKFQQNWLKQEVG